MKKLAYETDKAGYTTNRGRTARKDRRVTLRPAPDTMAVLSALLPVEQGVACLAALRKYADSAVATGDGRSRDQVMADTLVERLTGQARAQDVNVEVGIVLPLDALLDPESAAAGDLVGHGPLPAGIVTDLLRNTEGKRWWRRLFSHPENGTLVGGDPERGSSTGSSPSSSTSATAAAAATPSATPRSDNTTTSSSPGPAVRPVSPTAEGCAPGGTT